MTEQKQIEELFKDLCEAPTGGVNEDFTIGTLKESHTNLFIRTVARHLVSLNYHKQSEGEWVYNTDDFTPKQRCTVCGYNKPIVAGEGVIQEPKHFCPNCGARMKGENK